MSERKGCLPLVAAPCPAAQAQVVNKDPLREGRGSTLNRPQLMEEGVILPKACPNVSVNVSERARGQMKPGWKGLPDWVGKEGSQ